MADAWGALGALAAIGIPMRAAWRLLGRPSREDAARRGASGKMRSEEER